MQDGSRQSGQGINLATHSFTKQECIFLANILSSKFNLETSVVKSGHEGQWRISVKKKSLKLLASIVSEHIVPEMQYKLAGYL